jgi:hypothetical protein
MLIVLLIEETIFSNPSGSYREINSVKFDGNGILYGLRTNSGANYSDLVTIDLDTGIITSPGLIDDMQYMEAIAFLITGDTTAPIISETTPVTASGTDTTPDYTFTSDEAGDITYGGSCTSLTTTASVGANTITFETLALGTYTNCTITVTDDALNASNVLAVTAFTITAPASGGSSGSRATKKVVVAPGYPSSPTLKPTDCLPSYVFSPSTGILCPKEIPSKFVFLNNLQSGMIHSDVKELQKYLNTHGFPVALSGAGSLGNETTKFGALTKKALIKFQIANNINPAVGYFGPITRGLINGSI